MPTTYLLPTGAAVLPPTGSAFDSCQRDIPFGANLDWAELIFPVDMARSAFFVFPVPEYYAGGTRSVRVRWTTSAIVNAVDWHVTFGPRADGAVWDAVMSATDTLNDIAKGVAEQVNDALIPVTSAAWTGLDVVVMRIWRDPGAGGDTLVESAMIKEISIIMEYPDRAIVTPITNGLSPYAVTLNDESIYADAVGGIVIANLPTAAGVTGKRYEFLATNIANAVTLVPQGGEFIYRSGGVIYTNAAPYTVLALYDTLTIESNGTDWYVK